MLSAWFHASTQFLFSGSSPSSSLSRSPMATSVRIAVVGDVHDDWNLQEDAKALQFLQPDLVLFTGDFGNENVELVRNVANLELAKAVILGNHDAWTTQKFSANLDKDHVGYRRVDFPVLKLSVVGGRPFSCGGKRLFRKRLLSARYGIHDMEASTKRICEAALGTPEDHAIIFLAHNGPTGLGSDMNDICGVDWAYVGGDHGDHGDPDLAQAISHLKETTQFSIPLVVFGHMHKELAHGNGHRKMIVVGEDNTIYLNGAVVPRVKKMINEQGTSSTIITNNEAPSSTPEPQGTIRAFTVVEIRDGSLDKIAETWVAVIGDEARVAQEHILFKNSMELSS